MSHLGGVIRGESGAFFDSDGQLSVHFYNSETYDSLAEAMSCGAVYDVPSTISLYGKGGLYDLKDIVNTLQSCVGSADITTLILLSDGSYIELESLIKNYTAY